MIFKKLSPIPETVLTPSKTGDSAFDSAIILLDFGKYRDASVCLEKAILYKIIALNHIKNEQFLPDGNELNDFVENYQDTSLTDEFMIENIKKVLDLSQKKYDIINDIEAKKILNVRLMNTISRFFQQSNKYIHQYYKKNRKIGEKFKKNQNKKVLTSVEKLPVKNSSNRRSGKFWAIIIASLTCIAIVITILMLATKQEQSSSHNIQLSLTGNETGLIGCYYKTTQLDSDKTFNAIDKRIDPCINFNWTKEPPTRQFSLVYYSVSWNGYIRIDNKDKYQFFIQSDDGSRLWINDQLLIDDWNMHGVEERSTSLILETGWHKIRLDYLQLGGDAVIKLLWKSNDMQKQIIPQTHLKPQVKLELMKDNKEQL
jgi:hypothetical protein